MGEVYRASDTKLGRDVALKVLPRDLQQSPDRLSRFRREAHVLASLNHPRVAKIYDVVDVENVSALVLEFVNGPTLADRLSAGPLSLDETLAIAGDLGEALAAAHARGIVHRDLKPENVKLTADGHAKVLDFGLAKALSSSETFAAGSVEPAPFETTPGIIVGTTAYMAPEQARGEPVDHRADIWAFGCILYEMLSGVRFFDGRRSSEPVLRVLERDHELEHLPRNTPPALRCLLRSCLARDAKQRLAAATDALREIEDARRSPAEADGKSSQQGWAPGLVRRLGAAALATVERFAGGSKS
jgi:serine/threonine-protein kinase